MSIYENRDAVRLGPTRLAKFAPFITSIGIMLLLVVQNVGLPPIVSFPLQILCLIVLLAGIPLSRKYAGKRMGERGALRVDPVGLHWNGALVLPRAAARRGIVVPESPDGPMVRIQGPKFSRPVELAVPDVAQGRDILRALGLGASQIIATFVGRSRLLPSQAMRMGWLVGAGMLFVIAGFALTFGASVKALIFMPMIFPLLMLAFWPSRVDVGTDGVLVRWLGTRKFVPYAEVDRVEPTDTGVRLILEDRFVDLPVGPMPTRRGDRPLDAQLRNERDALIERIRSAMVAPAGDAPAAQLEPSMLARGGRTPSDWLASLRSMVAKREGRMRAAPVLDDQLWALLSDPSTAPSTRAGAAVVLASHADEGTREKLRIAAQSIASPKLRVVIETAADGEEHELELVRALDEVLDERKRRL
jgi:hypothetical protein